MLNAQPKHRYSTVQLVQLIKTYLLPGPEACQAYPGLVYKNTLCTCTINDSVKKLCKFVQTTSQKILFTHPG